jgi:hypothetical protein
MPGIEVFQDLRVLTVELVDGVVVVDVYGGPDGVIGTVTYSVPTLADVWDCIHTLQTWRQQATPVTWVRQDTTVALLDDQGLIAGALSPAAGA